MQVLVCVQLTEHAPKLLQTPFTGTQGVGVAQAGALHAIEAQATRVQVVVPP